MATTNRGSRTPRLWKRAALLLVSAAVFFNFFVIRSMTFPSSLLLRDMMVVYDPAAKRMLIPPSATFSARHYYPLYTQVPSWIESYIEFHNEHVMIDNRTKEARLKPGTKFLLYRCDNLCGGIGDRINGMVTLFYVAMTTNRVLLIDHERPSALTDVLVPNRIQWNVSRKNLPAHGQKSANDKFNVPYLVEPCLLEDDEGISVKTNQWYGEAYIWKSRCMKEYLKNQNASHVIGSSDEISRHLYRWAFWTMFRFSDQVLDRADKLRKMAGLSSLLENSGSNNLKDGNGHDLRGVSSNEEQVHNVDQAGYSPTGFVPYIGIHVRGERHNTEDDLHKFLKCAQDFRDEIQKAKQKQQPSSLNPRPIPRLIFIADDSYQGARSTLKPTMQSWDPDSVRFVNISVIHTDRTFRSGVEDLRAAHIETYAELVVLLDSECLVRSRSGFSELPHRITISNDATMERCGVKFDECTAWAVKSAVQTLDWNTIKTKESGSNKTWSSWVTSLEPVPKGLAYLPDSERHVDPATAEA